MAISFPISLPAIFKMAEITIRANSIVGETRSPFTMTEQVYVHQGEWWEMDVMIPPMVRADAEQVIAALLSLNGKQGTFLLGDPAGAVPRGSWSGLAVVRGARAAGIKTLPITGLNPFATVKAGDWIQIGSGATTNLHKVVQDGTADSGGDIDLEIWPRTRVDLADATLLITANTKGVWRLASNERSWSIAPAQIYDLRFSCVESLNA